MERSFLLQRGKIDLETGEFWATVATNGEASDRHILDLASVRVADRVPMFANHNPDPLRQLGSWTNAKVAGKTTRLGGASLKMLGRLPQDGDGEVADIRRDVARMIHSGDITAMSVHWDPVFNSVPRKSLPKHHFAFSDIEGGWEDPKFITDWDLMENSIVGLPADKAAIVGRSQDLTKPEHVRAFYDVLVNGDPLSRDRALEALYVDAAQVDGWEEIECEDGKVFVPAGVARVWGQSIPEEEDATEKAARIIREINANEPVREWLERCEEESTEPEPVSVPESETTERDEPVSVPPLAATGRADVALPAIPSLQDRQARMKRRVVRLLAEKMGFVES